MKYLFIALFFVLFGASNAMALYTASTVKAVWTQVSGFSVMLDNGFFANQGCMFAVGGVNINNADSVVVQNMHTVVRDAYKTREILTFVMSTNDPLACVIDQVIEGDPSPYFQ